MIFTQRVIEWFTNDPDVLSQGTYYLQLICICIPAMAVFQVLVGTFQGSGHTVYARFMDMGRLWGLPIPMILLFKHFTHWGSNAIWYAMVLSNVIICILGYLLYLKGGWQQQIFSKKSRA
ncbi:MatE protein [Geosporobacter subterraneus DSM 17957]|uniref:MatE protein n=1 Tax=Geosporobacter subterraneus DSM 17957 TaxID=1121919 RepID=A0A1M6FRJ5_9FIRM|nr:MatE protein [Geosporobacter subterraneus DSM 17957]